MKKSGKKIWKDGFGNAILSENIQKSLKIYGLSTRFNPAWNDLVWSDAFPQMILKLIAGDEYQLPAKYDKRVLTNQQIQPVKVYETTELMPANPAEQVDLSKYFWLLILLLFIAERVLSHKNKILSINE